MVGRGLAQGVHVLMSLAAWGTAPAAAAGASGDPDFEARFDAVRARTSTVFRVSGPNASASAAAVTAAAPHGVALAPSVTAMPELSSLLTAVTRQLSDVKRCYREAQAHPRRPFHGRALIHMTIRRSGTVGGVGLEPKSLEAGPLGHCLMRSIARWRFPSFSGETAPGLTHGAISVSFAFRFSP